MSARGIAMVPRAIHDSLRSGVHLR